MSDLRDRYDLWIDPDTVFDERFVWSMKMFSKNPAGIRKGERIRVGDHSGFRCIGTVTKEQSNGTVLVELDWTTVYYVDTD